MKCSDSMAFRVFKTRLGWCGIVGSPRGILNLILPMSSRKKVEGLLAKMCGRQRETRFPKETWFLVLSAAERQVKEYLAGKRKVFDLPVFLGNRSAFERRIYEMTRRIPYGRTTTYGRLAQQASKPAAARAVGRAMARNPVPLIIPCHRVVGSDGRLCGFSSEGGLELKQRLLDLESRAIAVRNKKD